jgi:hypothetical protein
MKEFGAELLMFLFCKKILNKIKNKNILNKNSIKKNIIK